MTWGSFGILVFGAALTWACIAAGSVFAAVVTVILTVLNAVFLGASDDR